MTEREYELVDGWEKAPAGLRHGDVSGVAVGADDRVYLLTRRDPGVVVYDRDGNFLTSWGADLLSEKPHGLTIAPDGTFYVVDVATHVVHHLTADGELLGTIGTPGTPSDTGFDGTLDSIHGGPPFHLPTNSAVGANGDLYVSDGYGNSRVHRFGPDGELVQSWGEPGSGPGQFHLVHGIAATADGRIVVCDEENDRLQFFTLDGEYLDEWTDIRRPTNIAIDAEGRVYVSELWRRPGEKSWRLGTSDEDFPGRMTVFDADGTVIARWGGNPDRTAPGNFIAPHDVAVDSRGDVYVAEVTWTTAGARGDVPEDSHTLQKFTLKTNQ
jgi:DNA-binding beta-propeller fold protein YncE